MNRQYLFALNELIKGNINRRFSGNYLWVIWYVISPLAITAVFSMLFSTMQGVGVKDYALYYLTGHIVFFAFASVVIQCVTALEENKDILLQTQQPLSIFVVARVVSAIIFLLFSLVSYVVLMVAYDVKPGLNALLGIAAVLLVIVLGAGIGSIFAVAEMYGKNTKILIQPMMVVLFLTSCIFYPVSSLGTSIQAIVKYNPLYAAITIVRTAVMYNGKAAFDSWMVLGIAAVAGLVLGIIVFSAGKKNILQRD